MKNLEFKINQETGRLDQVLAKLSNLSRTQIKDLVSQNLILVNDNAKKVSYLVQPDDIIKISIPEKKPLKVKAENIPLDIIFEDEEVVVVNKPQGMVVHPSAGHTSHTLVNALLYHVKNLATSPTQEEIFRPGIVHRIDKDTSGLLMVAKTDHARISLEKQLKEKINKREYIAIVHGNFTEQSGVIDAPIGRSKQDRKKQAVVKDGKPAKTHFKVIEQFQGYSLIQCRLETGRTHQIRVHLAYIGHPLAGDLTYGPKKTLPGDGQFLHAKTLGFYHPVTDEWLEFSVEPPKIFQDTLKYLRQTAQF